jgi:hypothetical protein
VNWLLVGASLAAVPAPAGAQTEGAEAPQPATRIQTAGDETGPSLELLEFLGEWESGSGEWIDPVEVQSPDWPPLSDGPSDDHSGTNDAETGNAN